jgi:acyl-CoA thioesterase-1
MRKRMNVWTVLACLLLAWQVSACRSSSGTPSSQSDGAGGQPPAAAPADVSQAGRPRVVFLGDSLTAGLGLLETQAYPALIQKMIDADGYDYDVENAGVSGDTTAGGLRRLEWSLQGNVKVLVVALGGNDGLRGLSVAEMKNNLTQIIEGARARNVMVILAGMEAPPNYGQEYAASFRAVFRDIAQKERVVFIPFLLDRVAGHADLNQADGIHPNERGAQIVADTVWRALRPALDQIAVS